MLVNSSAEQVRFGGSPSPGHGDGCRGPGGFPKSPSHAGSQERISPGVNLLGLVGTQIVNLEIQLYEKEYMDIKIDAEDQEAFLRAQASRGARKGFRLESICWD